MLSPQPFALQPFAAEAAALCVTLECRPEATPRSSTTSASSPEGTGAEADAPEEAEAPETDEGTGAEVEAPEVEASEVEASSLWSSLLGRKRPRYLRTSASLPAPPTAAPLTAGSTDSSARLG